MASYLNDLENPAVFQEKWNQLSAEVNTTRREWSSPYEGTRCYRNKAKYNLNAGGDNNVDPLLDTGDWFLVEGAPSS